MKEKYYLVSEETANRAGVDASLRTKVGDEIAISEKDVRNISLTMEERVKGLDLIEYKSE